MLHWTVPLLLWPLHLPRRTCQLHPQNGNKDSAESAWNMVVQISLRHVFAKALPSGCIVTAWITGEHVAKGHVRLRIVHNAITPTSCAWSGIPRRPNSSFATGAVAFFGMQWGTFSWAFCSCSCSFVRSQSSLGWWIGMRRW